MGLRIAKAVASETSWQELYAPARSLEPPERLSKLAEKKPLSIPPSPLAKPKLPDHEKGPKHQIPYQQGPPV